jgi:hypothetical protein
MRPRATSVTTGCYRRASPADHRPPPSTTVLGLAGKRQGPLQAPRVRHPFEIRAQRARHRPADVDIGSQSHPSTNHQEINCPARCRPSRLGKPSTTLGHRSARERLVVAGEYGAAIRGHSEAADAAEQNVSAWLTDAARRQLTNRGLRDIVAAWEHEHGALSGDELAAARALVDG